MVGEKLAQRFVYEFIFCSLFWVPLQIHKSAQRPSILYRHPEFSCDIINTAFGLSTRSTIKV